MGGCPFHSDKEGGETTTSEDGAQSAHSWTSKSGIGRRSFLASAGAIGGTSALSTVLRAEAAGDDPASMPFPNGDPSRRPEQQHRWSDVGRTDQFGNPAPPAHQLVFLLDYVGEDVDDDRDVVETTFTQLERAFKYDQREGLLFNVGYSPAYFKRHSAGTPNAGGTGCKA